ncbi:MAG: preprotein translocase subunit SecY [Planctomycetes bacterium]|nr:preprotein translocase subunit SecY [Planctomycetota bacterium]
MLDAIANIGRIPELRKKLLATAGILALARIGIWLPVPGIAVDRLTDLVNSVSSGAFGKVFALADLFAGGALTRASLFALGVMPYITASIVFQVLIAVIPSLEKIAKEGESGRRKINQYTRYAAVVICIVQGFGLASAAYGMTPPIVLAEYSRFGFIATAVVAMTAGSLLLMWMGEQIDEFGIGSGISLIIMINIISRAPTAVSHVYRSFDWTLGSAEQGNIDPARLVMLLGLFIFMIMAVVMITQAQRRIPMNHARRGGMGFAQRSYLPLKVNMAGVISIIFAQAIMMIPGILGSVNSYWLRRLAAPFQPWNFWYVTVYMLLIIFFTYFYTAVVFNPLEHAHQFKSYGAFIPGIRPGRKTAEYLEWVMNRITLPGAVFLAIIAVFPQIVSSTMNVDYLVASFFGGTGLLIVVGVALDLVQRIENYFMMQYYDGFLKGGRVRGRR